MDGSTKKCTNKGVVGNEIEYLLHHSFNSFRQKMKEGTLLLSYFSCNSTQKMGNLGHSHLLCLSTP